MKQISEYADNMIDNIMLTAWERGAYADQVTGYDEAEALYYQEQESNELKAYIADLEAEVEALRLHKIQEAQISEMRRVGNLMADHLNALGISRHDREWADASNPIPDESDPLKGVPYVSFSNEEIAAMTPEHPLYKLVHGERSK